RQGRKRGRNHSRIRRSAGESRTMTVDNRILQEVYRDDPWKMLVGCILLNQTSRTQVDGVREKLFERWPDAKAMGAADEEELSECVRSLGLHNRRATTLKRFSQHWSILEEPGAPWGWPPEAEKLYDLPGIGDYAV